MQRLVSGIHQFQSTVFAPRERFYRRLEEGQYPLALFITCSDSRICPNELTQTDPGELFILRNAGNIVPPYGATRGGGEAATIEYAVAALKVHDIVVCGHSHCGAMQALLDPAAAEKLPAVRDWLQHAEATRRIVEENYDHIEPGRNRLMATIEENVLVQLENLRTHPSVAAALGRGALQLHGWVYKFETGQVFAYSPEQEQFLPIEEVEKPTEAVTATLPSI
jgi:carbonic anhydrase